VLGGLESTVIDLTTEPATLLAARSRRRPSIEEIIGPVQKQHSITESIARSPGQMKRHYSPATPVEFTTDDGSRRVRELIEKRCGWDGCARDVNPIGMEVIEVLPADPTRYSASLYAALHRLDAAGLDRLVIALPPEDDDWLAIHDRLQRMQS